MSSHEIVDPLRHATEVGRVDLGVSPTEPGMVDVAICECGLPEPCCDDYCSIDDCDWLIY
jgi:hypothetical protein